jgi:hypothetical protein
LIKGETAMACPDCGSPAGHLRFATSIEIHGLDCGPYETFNEEFIVCRQCGGRYDVREWDGTQELREISIPSDRIENAAARLNLLRLADHPIAVSLPCAALLRLSPTQPYCNTKEIQP